MSFISSRAWAFKQTVLCIFHAKALFLLALSLAGFALTIPVFLGTLAWSLSVPVFDVPMRTEITIFTKRTVGEASAQKIAEKISRNSIIESSRVISKADALAMVNQSLGMKSRTSTENPLPNIIIATVAKNVSDEELAVFSGEISKMSQVDYAAYDDQWARHLKALLTAVSVTVGILGSVIVALVLLVIAASVRLTTSAQRDEIRALYLFGATNSFIKRPYVWRGFITMGLAAGLSLGISSAGISLLAAPVANFTKLYGVTVLLALPSPDWCILYVGCAALLGAFIGAVAASDAIRKVQGH